MTTHKRKTHYGLLVLLALLLGGAIQFGMRFLERRQETASGRAILSELQQEASGAAQTRLADRTRQWEQAVQSLTPLAGKKRQASDAGDPSLLILVNAWSPLPEEYTPELELAMKLDGRDYELDRRCVSALLEMLSDCREAGGRPYICSAYRTRAQQKSLYDTKIGRLVMTGVAWADAPALAAESVAAPGTSEHQLGLAVDIIDEVYTALDEGQEDTVTQKWLMANSWRYGFILRYPNGTSESTGIVYEPWHYRYVGKHYAEEIYRMGLTLEEYLEAREGR
ncbi:MAG: M15 family metallopeptidase [Oscillospiraceae bacterium]|nr:M15 family metallopeptidase [Oscillospiraceae bacterium]